ncbi:MAG TPA: hypothetical protein VIG48_04420 [Jatrophihabitans sp.]|jgi:hypothetical protein
MSEPDAPRQTPLAKAWNRAKQQAPRQKALAATVHAVRRSKPASAAQARETLVAEAARRGVADLSDRELATMTDAVTLRAREAATGAVDKGKAGARTLWTKLQTTRPAWVELPDNVAAFNRRSDQLPVEVSVIIEVPEVVRRLTDELPADADGVRTVNVWLATDPATTVAAVCVGMQRLGRVPDAQAVAIRGELARRRFWLPATLRDGVVAITLPDRP